MGGQTSRKSRHSPHWAPGLLALGLLASGPLRAADTPHLPRPTPSAMPTEKVPGDGVPKYDLETLRAIALKYNSAITAARATLASAIAGQQSVENIKVPTFLQPDLPIRRKQAALGVQAAEAGVRQAELLVVFGVQFAYVSHLYAREQERIAREAVDDKEKEQNLVALSKTIRELFNEDSKVDTDLKKRDALFLEGVLFFARSRLTEAETGSRRALSALREAIGGGCDVPLSLKHNRLLDVKATLDRRQLIELALANRPDLLAASINVLVCDLEVKAQASRNSLNVRTFASGADLHANPLPAGRYDQEYRPGVSGPEMPPFLSGKKCDRVARAAALASRAASVSDKARALIILEVEQSYLRYEEATAKIAYLTQAAAKLKLAMKGELDAKGDNKDKNGGKGVEGASTRLQNSIKAGGESKVALDDVLKFGQVYSQIRIQANEARYQQLIALITLERATGAAFRADLSGVPEVKDE